RVRLPQCWHNRVELRPRDQPAGASAMPSLSRDRRRRSSRVLVIAKSESLCPIHPERVAPPLCVAAEWIARCKVSPPAARTATRECLAKSSAQKNADLSESFESVQPGAPSFQLPPFSRESPFSCSCELIQLTQSNVS